MRNKSVRKEVVWRWHMRTGSEGKERFLSPVLESRRILQKVDKDASEHIDERLRRRLDVLHTGRCARMKLQIV